MHLRSHSPLALLFSLTAACASPIAEPAVSDPAPAPESGESTELPENSPPIGETKDAPSGGSLPAFPRAKLGVMQNIACRITPAETVRCSSRVTSDGFAPAAEVPGVVGAVALSSGRNNVCALRKDGKVDCWGKGNLGDGELHESFVGEAVRVEGLSDVDALPHGSETARCARTSAGRWLCWGLNANGEFGTGAKEERLAPIEVPIPAQAVSVALGGTHHCYAFRSSVFCAGANNRGQLGDGTIAARSEFSEVATAFPDIVGLEASTCAGCFASEERSGRSTCALLSDGRARCWGQNVHDMLGDGSETYQVRAVVNGFVSGAHAIHLGGLSACAIGDAGKVTCWGADSVAGAPDKPGGVVIKSDVEELASTGLSTCASMRGGGVKCWGITPPIPGVSAASRPTDVPGL